MVNKLSSSGGRPQCQCLCLCVCVSVCLCGCVSVWLCVCVCVSEDTDLGLSLLYVQILIEHHSLHVNPNASRIRCLEHLTSNILIYRLQPHAKDGAVLLTARHRYTAFAQLPVGCRPDQRITLVVARGLPNNQIIMERPEGLRGPFSSADLCSSALVLFGDRQHIAGEWK